MEATDLKPNRLGRARFKIDDLLRARKDGQTALVAYAGDAFVVTPLTDDAGTIAAQLNALSPRIMPAQGTRLDLGLEAAARLLRQAGLRQGDVLAVTAGEDVTAAKATAARLKGEGYRVSLLGVGSRDGAPIPLPDGGFLKRQDGGLWVSRLDIKALWDTAQAGGGLYRTLDAGSADTDAVVALVDRRGNVDQSQDGQKMDVDQWREAGVWLLPPLLMLSALAFRRGWLGLLLLAVLAPVPQPATAFEWRDLWLTPDQRAQRALEAGDAKAAAEGFRDPAWKAAAEYRAGAFEQAAKQLESLDTAPTQYNRGNALARQGQLEEALKAYDRALQLKPGDEDATYNRALVEQALKQQQQQQDKPSEGSDGQSQGTPNPPPPGDQQEGQQSRQDAADPPESAGQSSAPEHAAESSPPSGNADAKPASQPAASPGEQPSAEGRQDPVPGKSPPAAGSDGQDRQPDQGQSQAPDSGPGQPATKPGQAPAEARTPDETEQATAQWLRRIPDDPGGLLKRKFQYQYRQRQSPSP